MGQSGKFQLPDEVMEMWFRGSDEIPDIDVICHFLEHNLDSLSKYYYLIDNKEPKHNEICFEDEWEDSN